MSFNSPCAGWGLSACSSACCSFFQWGSPSSAMEEAAVCRSSRDPHKVCQWSELCLTPPRPGLSLTMQSKQYLAYICKHNLNVPCSLCWPPHTPLWLDLKKKKAFPIYEVILGLTVLNQRWADAAGINYPRGKMRIATSNQNILWGSCRLIQLHIVPFYLIWSLNPSDNTAVSAVLPLSLLSLQVASVLRPLVFLRQFSRNEVLQIRPVITQELLLSGSLFWGGFRRGWQTVDVTLWRKDWLLLPGGRYLGYWIAAITMSWFPYHLSG